MLTDKNAKAKLVLSNARVRANAIKKIEVHLGQRAYLSRQFLDDTVADLNSAADVIEELCKDEGKRRCHELAWKVDRYRERAERYRERAERYRERAERYRERAERAEGEKIHILEDQRKEERRRFSAEEANREHWQRRQELAREVDRYRERAERAEGDVQRLKDEVQKLQRDEVQKLQREARTSGWCYGRPVTYAFQDVVLERKRQNYSWAYDDSNNTMLQWIAILSKYFSRLAYVPPREGFPFPSEKARFRVILIKIAAVALAGAESMDRRLGRDGGSAE